jgi:predicted PurR-regulated permease PerM
VLAVTATGEQGAPRRTWHREESVQHAEPTRTPVPAVVPAPAPTRVDVDWPSLLVLATLLATPVITLDVLGSVDNTSVHLLLAVVGALALDRPVGLVRRWTGLSRAGAVAAVVTVTAALAIAAAVLLVPAAVEQASQVRDDAPQVLADLERLPVVGQSLQENDVPAQVQRWLDELPRRATESDDVVGTAQTAAVQAVGLIETLLLLVLLLAEGPGLVSASRRLVPERWRPALDGAGRSVQVVVGRYAVGSLLLACLAGTAAFVIGLALAVPLVALAALWAFLWNFVPQLGGIVGGAGLVLLALTASPSSAVVALVVWLVYMQVENRVVQPVVVGRAVQLSPLTTMVVALVGVAVAGLLGAVLAIPLVAALKAASREMRAAERRR